MGIKMMLDKVNALLADDCTIELSACVDRDGYPEYFVHLKWEPEGSPPVNIECSQYSIEVALACMLDFVSEIIEPLKATRKCLIEKVKTLSIEDLKRIEESGIIKGWTMPDRECGENE